MYLSKRVKTLNWLYFLFYCLLVLSLFAGKGGIIRILSAINILVVFSLIWQNRFSQQWRAYKFLFVTLAFILINMLATRSISYDNEYLKIIFSVFFGVGLYTYALKEKINKEWVLNAVAISLIIYIILQLTSFFLLEKPNGTFKNPHYIALFSAYASILAVYYYFAEKTVRRFISIPVLLVLTWFILLSSSRPTWISLIFATFMAIFFLSPKLRLTSLALVVTVPTFLYLTNLGGFGGRMADLILNIYREERVVIWSDTWVMQTSSTLYQWLFGHGLNSFETDFKAFSTYHLVGNDFTMPHNSILEVLYATGLLGLSLYLFIYGYIFYRLFTILPSQSDKKLGLILLAFITVNLIMSLITIKWFTHLTSYPLAFVIGMICYTEAKQHQHV